jgi:hypothetical protein
MGVTWKDKRLALDSAPWIDAGTLGRVKVVLVGGERCESIEMTGDVRGYRDVLTFAARLPALREDGKYVTKAGEVVESCDEVFEETCDVVDGVDEA